MAPRLQQPGHDAGAQKVATLLPLAQGQIAAQLGEADGLVTKTLALLGLSVALLTAVCAYRLADSHLNLWYLAAAGFGLSAILFFRALLPGPSLTGASNPGQTPESGFTRVELWSAGWFGPWRSNRLDTGQPPNALYEGIRSLSELEAYRYILGTLQDAINFNRAALRWQSHLLSRGEILLGATALLGGLALPLANVVF